MADSSLYEKMDLFYLGREIDPGTGQTSSIPFLYKNKHLTTHAAIIGMTGSGKTGLGVCLLEEAAIDRLPAIVIDPKGDMANLLLTFPEMRPEDFLPWIDPEQAVQKGMSEEEFARQTAHKWEEGIRSWDQDRQRISRLKSSAAFSLFTPGSSSGNPVCVLDSMEAPESRVLNDNTTAAGVVNATVSSLLGLIGIEADPLASREHILLSSILLHCWRQGIDLTLESLISQVVTPPFERIGVFSLDTFYPQAKRMELAMQLNNILASPAFRDWVEGEPLRIDSLLYTADGRPRISIFSIAHLGESERMFFVTMLLGKLISWMRRQEGTDSLRCLLYMDEIFGYFPPVGNPPSKEPMLLLLKQARAYGLGIVLATQNPVDHDYKGLSNIGTWFIGRLQTKQDQGKVTNGISENGAFSRGQIQNLLANLRSRTFLMQSAHLDEPVLFETRWVLSYLKGPISLSEIKRLTADTAERVQDDRNKETVSVPASGNNVSMNPLLLPEKVVQRFVPPPIPVQGLTYIPWLAASATVRFFSKARNIDRQTEISLKIPLDDSFRTVDWDLADTNNVEEGIMVSSPPESMQFMRLPSDFSSLQSLRDFEKEFMDYLYRNRELPLKRVAQLKMESRPDESDSQFQQRIVDSLREKKEEEVDRLEQKYQARQEGINRRLEKLYARLEKEKGDVWAKGIDTVLSFGVALFGAIAGRRALSVSTATRSARGVRSAGRVLKEKGDVRMVADEVRSLEQESADLALELQEKRAEVVDRYAAEKFPVEQFAITPRRSDIYDVQICLQWEPVLNLAGLNAGGS